MRKAIGLVAMVTMGLAAIGLARSAGEGPMPASVGIGPLAYVPEAVPTIGAAYGPTQPEAVPTSTATPESPKLAPTGTTASVEAASFGAGFEGWLAAAGWPRELWAEAARVAQCESGQKPHSASSRYTDGNGIDHQDLGLFQLHQTWLPDGTAGWGWFTVFGYSLDEWSNPVTNARVAYHVYQYDLSRGQRPWTQWTCKP